VYKTPEIRNVAVLGHGDTGKTSLTSWLLYASGSVKRLGKVDDGGATTDFDEEEIERKISMQTAMAALEWKGCKVNLVDTPGYAAFVADARAGVAVADAGLLLVDAVSGVEVITRRGFRFAEAENLPLIFVVNKMDRERASFERTLGSIQERFGREAVALHIPLGEEDGFEGLVDLLSMQARRYEKDGNGTYRKVDIPAELQDQAAGARAALVEMIAENDDALMETFFENGDLTPEQLTGGLRSAVAGRKLFPVCCSSSAHGVGIQSLLELLVDVFPAPDARGPVAGKNPDDDSEISRPVSDDEPLSLFVFKTVADPYAGRLSLFRVQTGHLTGDTQLVNIRTGHGERLGSPQVVQGKQAIQVASLHAGDLGVVTKLKETLTSDTLSDPAHKIGYPVIPFPEPAISFAVEPKSKGDEEKIGNALARLTEEDPVLKVGRDARTHELLVSGTGQVHVEVAIAKMKRKFGVDAVLKQPKVPYLETIKRKTGQIHGRHKKQTGGRGQFGDCVIEIEPLPRGSGFEFVDKIFGGAIPQTYRPAVEQGIRETADRGWLTDNPLVDFRATLVDGSYHNVDSSEMAFKIAGSLAFKAAMEKAAPTLLEPVMDVEISAPEEYMGDIMGDLSSRRGKPQGMEADGNYQVIRAQVPMAEMLTYASTLKSITSDRGTYHMEFSHYAEAPATVREHVMAEAAREKAEQA
jgi:elongation factor G